MADWVHCNSCFHQPADGKNFSLTNCGHIYCEDCAKPGCQMVCKMCKVNCSTYQLSSKMKPEVELFFTDPVVLMKKQHKQLIQVVEFQSNQRKRLASYIQQKLFKQSSMISKSQKALQVIQEYEKENKLLKEEILYLKRMLKSSGVAQKTPPSPACLDTGSPVRNHIRQQRLSPSPRRIDRSPRTGNHNNMSIQQSPYRPSSSSSSLSFQQMSQPPYEMPSVTTGRVLMRTPDRLASTSRMMTQSTPLSSSRQLLYAQSPRVRATAVVGQPSPYRGGGMSCPDRSQTPLLGAIPPHMSMPLTPLPGQRRGMAASTPMDMDQGNSSACKVVYSSYR